MILSVLKVIIVLLSLCCAFSSAAQPLPLRCERINLVYTWVNGSDPNHSQALSKYAKLAGKEIGANRFREMDGLLYSLRSVEKNAPWIDTIFIVTADQIPSFLNTDHPRVKLISHRDFFKSKDNLPTFSSNAIEANFVNFPDFVGPCFIYLNDDMFFSNPVSPSDFWSESQGQLLYKDWWTAPASQEVLNWDAWHRSVTNSNYLLDRLWGETAVREYPAHGPYFFTLEVLRMMGRTLADEFNTTSTHRFREDTDTAFPFLYHHFTKKYFHSTMMPENILVWQGIVNDPEKVCRDMQIVDQWRPKVLCFNDQMEEEEANPSVIKCVKDFMNHRFPSRSAFERS